MFANSGHLVNFKLSKINECLCSTSSAIKHIILLYFRSLKMSDPYCFIDQTLLYFPNAVHCEKADPRVDKGRDTRL